MKKTISYISLMLVLAVAAVSCADQNEFDTNAFVKGSFDRWMEKYHPGIPRLTGQNEGIYMEWLERGPQESRLREGYWFLLDYTAREQNGDVFYTRSGAVAHQIFGASFDYSVHYVPEQIQYKPDSLMFFYAQGQIRALSLMNEGDSVRLYLPPSQGFWGNFGFTYSTASHFGYSPSASYIAPDRGMIFDMRLNRIIKDVYLYEREEVERYAADKLGITNPSDSVVLGVYAKKTVENRPGEPVKAGSVVDIYYAGRFLDGHVFDTNDTEVGEENRVSASGSPLSVVVGTASVIPAMDAVLLGMRAGERATFVTVSDQAYGSIGSTNETYGYVVIPPYTPLVFDIYVESVENVEEDEE